MVAYLPHWRNILILSYITCIHFFHSLPLVVFCHPLLFLLSLTIFFIPRKGLTSLSHVNSLISLHLMSLESTSFYSQLSAHIFLIDCCIISLRPPSSIDFAVVLVAPHFSPSWPTGVLVMSNKPLSINRMETSPPHPCCCPTIFGDTSLASACDSARHTSIFMNNPMPSIIDTMHLQSYIVRDQPQPPQDGAWMSKS